MCFVEGLGQEQPKAVPGVGLEKGHVQDGAGVWVRPDGFPRQQGVRMKEYGRIQSFLPSKEMSEKVHACILMRNHGEFPST